jgi:RHS repeat-associated protein
MLNYLCDTHNFSGSTYANFSKTTDANGQAVFTLPLGSYRFRSDLNGTQFWSGTANTCLVPGCVNDAVTVTKPVILTVVDGSGAPKAGVSVYAFNGSTYTGYSKTTNASGQAVFTLPAGSYRFRADYGGIQYWSGSVNHCSLPGCESLILAVGPQNTATSTLTSTSTPTCTTTPTFTNTFTPIPTDTPTGTDTPTLAPTDTDNPAPTGTETAPLPLTDTDTPTLTQTAISDGGGTGFNFQNGRVEKVSFMSSRVRLAREDSLDPTPAPGVLVTVQDTAGTAKAGLKVYAFDGIRYTGVSRTTDVNGEAALNLPDGSYRFRADFNGIQFWSSHENSCNRPDCQAAMITVTVPLTVTVMETGGAVKGGLPVYAFTGSTYSGYSQTTDAAGQAVFTLPQGSYRFRADLNGTQFWSGSGNDCSLPGCTSASVNVMKPVTVTVRNEANKPYPNLNVYAFDGSRYTGYHGSTDENGRVILTLPQGSYRFRADFNGVQFWSSQFNDCTLPGCLNASVTLPGGMTQTDVTIDYSYDPLYRLTEADYSDGDYYHYDYDNVGNRLEQNTTIKGLLATTDYTYDIANRLTSAGGVAYNWDANGNLLNDGKAAYTYDSANRLAGYTSDEYAITYAYNGQGDRLQQTVNGKAITYVNDLNSSLTQVVADGANTYLYGNERLAQENTKTEYFLGDALGSVRQMFDVTGAVVLTQSYDPYGNKTISAGTATTIYGFDAEQMDYYIKLINLRSRMYDPSSGRFLTRDSWQGDYNSPLSLNAWIFGFDNPTTYIDPTGHYGKPAHLNLTKDLVSELLATGYPNIHSQEWASDLPLLISEWDDRVDFSVLTNPGTCIWCHFASINESNGHLNYAINTYTSLPYLLGGALHQLQDVSSHTEEGWTVAALGHIWVKAYTDDIGRPQSLIEDFFNGGHWSSGRWVFSWFPAHPREKVQQDVQSRNPSLSMANLSDWDIIDLYLRLDATNADPSLAERMYFHFNTDKYIKYSDREIEMEKRTRASIQLYLDALENEDCPMIDAAMPPSYIGERRIQLLLTK